MKINRAALLCLLIIITFSAVSGAEQSSQQKQETDVEQQAQSANAMKTQNPQTQSGLSAAIPGASTLAGAVSTIKQSLFAKSVDRKLFGVPAENFVLLQVGYKNDQALSSNLELNRLSFNISANTVNEDGFGGGIGFSVFMDENMPDNVNDYPCPHNSWRSLGYFNKQPTYGLDLKAYIPPFVPNAYCSLYAGVEAFLVQQTEVQKSLTTGWLYEGNKRTDVYSSFEYGIIFHYDYIYVAAGRSTARGYNGSIGIAF